MNKTVIKTLLMVSLSLIMIISLVSVWNSISYAEAKDNKQVEETEGPTRTNHKPTLKDNVTSEYTAYGLVGTQFGFANGWLEDYFTDEDTGDTITYYSSLDGGVTKTQDGITTLYHQDENRYVTTYAYTPTSTGTKEIRLYAYDGTIFSDDYVKITLNVSNPNNNNYRKIQIKVSSDIGDFVAYYPNGNPIAFTSRTTDSTTGITTCSAWVTKNNGYSFLGIPAGGDSDYPSGMTFDIPSDYNADGTEEDPDIIYIKQVNVTVNANHSNTDPDYPESPLNPSLYTLGLKDADLQDVIVGKISNPTLNKVTPVLVYAHGNAELYTYTVTPGAALYENAVLYQGNQAFTADTTVKNETLTLPTAVNYTLSVPTGATLKVFRQIRNYQVEELTTPSHTTSDGYDSYTYRLPQNGKGYTYRVSETGKITRAGFLSLSTSGSKTIDLSDDSPSLTLAQATATPSQESDNIFEMTAGYDPAKTVGSRAEDSVLLNAHIGSNNIYSALYHNYINVTPNHSYKIRGYRAAWQIINSDVDNIMIEPDFHFQVVEGTASDLTITPDPDHNSWCTVTPNTGASGVYVIKVTYDAIDVDGMSYSNNTAQRFYATAAGREGYIVINADSSKYTDMTLNAVTSGSRDANMDWDSEIDTVYYTGTQGTFKFDPTASNKDISSVEFSTTPGGTYTAATYSNGKYVVHPVQGYNMIKVTWDDNTVSYAPIRAAKIKILVDGTDLANNPTVNANVNHTIKLEGVYMPVPKFSGIYNPMMNKANYTVGNSTVSGNNVQYNFITQNKITWKPTSTGTYNFTNGYHSMRMFCNTTAKWGHHRLLTDVGVGANFNAGLVNGVFNIYPDFNIVVS